MSAIRRHVYPAIVLAGLVTALMLAASAGAQTSGGTAFEQTDPAQPTTPTTPVPPLPGPVPPAGPLATLDASGLAVAPAGAPKQVRQIIAAGNKIAFKKYIYGGGHRRWRDKGYDCSGSVSYALRGAKLLSSPLASGDFMNWGEAGPGAWVTIYTKASHMYMVVAGLRFDTSGRGKAGSRWQLAPRSAKGYTVRHPVGL